MAPSSNRSSSLPLLGGGILILLVALGALWMLDDTPADDPGTGPSLTDPSDVASTSPMELPDDRPELDLPDAGASEDALPIPSVIDRGAIPEFDETAWEDPVIIVGWVEDGEGERMPDVEVNLYDDIGEFMDSALTGEQGEFLFTSDVALAADWSLGTEPEIIFDEEDPSAVSPAYYTHPDAAVPGEPPVECRLVLAQPPRIEGRVYDAVTREPIELADIEVVCMSPAWEAEFQDAYSDEGGNFGMTLVDVPRRDLIVRVADDDGRYDIFGPLTLAPGEVRYLDVPLAAPLELEGTVRRAGDGTPVDGADVTVLPAHIEFEGTDAWDVTDQDGEWAIDDIGVPADRVWLLVEAEDHSPELVRVDDLSRPVEILLGDVVTVTGRIIDAETKEPVADAMVRFVLNGPSGLLDDYEEMDFVEDDGTFSIPLESAPASGAMMIVETDEHVRFRVPLSSLAPTDLGLRSYDVSVALRPLPIF